MAGVAGWVTELISVKCLEGCYASMYSVNILNKLYQKLFQNVEIFSGKFSAKLSNQKKFLGTRFPGSDTFSTPGSKRELPPKKGKSNRVKKL
jgi:ABC-type branched-subunit amino acid transport system permease subunit